MIALILLVGLVIAIILAARGRNEQVSPFRLRIAAPGESTGTAATTPLRAKLDEWVDAGLIDSNVAGAVERYEADHEPTAPNRVPLAAEAIGYIGGGLVFAAVALLVGNRWENLSTLERIVALGLPTMIAAAAGWWTGRSEDRPLQRLGSVLWFLAVAGTAAVAAELWVDALHDGDPPDHGTALFIGACALAAAAGAFWLRRMELQQLAMLAAAVTTTLGAADAVAGLADTTLSPVSAGLALTALGAAWLTVALVGRLTPSGLACLSGSVLMLVGPQILTDGNESAGVWLGLLAAIALLVIGVTRGSIAVLLAGTAGLFQWTPQIALFYLEDTLGAEATLLVIGTLLLALAGFLTRIYGAMKGRHADTSADGHTPTGPNGP